MGKHVRTIGILGAFVGCLLHFAGFLTNNWAENEPGDVYWGLWNYCTNLTSQNKSLQVINATALVFTSTSPQTTIKNNTLDERQNEAECDQFSMSEIPGTFHLVRALMVCATITFAYCILSGRLLKHKIETDEPCILAHRGEIALILGACSSLVAISIFSSSYRSYDLDDHGEVDLGSSFNIARASAIIICIGACVMIAPRFKDRFSRCLKGESFSFLVCELRDGHCYGCPVCQERRTPQTRGLGEAAEISVVRRSSFVSLDETYIAENNTNSNEPDQNIFIVDIRNSSPYSSRGSASFNDPAPRYEDLSPRDIETLPPPPSYDEVVAGMYATTDNISSSSAAYPSAPVPSRQVLTDEPELPPPVYEESMA